MPLTTEQQAFQAQLNADPALQPIAHWTREQMLGGRTLESVKQQIRGVIALVGPTREDGSLVIFAPRTVTLAQITNAIIGVFEGGYSPWIHSVERLDVSPEALTADLVSELASNVWYSVDSFWQNGGRMRMTFDHPNAEEGNGKGRVEIGLPEMISGLEKMAVHAPKHFALLVEENDDAITHDVFMQFVVLGEIVYG